MVASMLKMKSGMKVQKEEYVLQSGKVRRFLGRNIRENVQNPITTEKQKEFLGLHLSMYIRMHVHMYIYTVWQSNKDIEIYSCS